MVRNLLPDREALVQTLKRHRWVISDVARELQVSRQGLYKAMRRLGIRRRPQTKAVYREMRARGGSI